MGGGSCAGLGSGVWPAQRPGAVLRHAAALRPVEGEVGAPGGSPVRIYGQWAVRPGAERPRRGALLPRPEQLLLLHALQQELQQGQREVQHVTLIEAKAPIVQFYLQGLLVDLSVQSVLGLANSALMARYCAQCPQLRLLARKVKEFATAWGIKSGKDGTLSSYGYTLLCAHFLQNAPLTGVDLPILPVFPTGAASWAARDDLAGTVDAAENADPNAT